MAEQNRTRVLILGGEFAGVYTALTLENYLKRIPNLEIGLIQQRELSGVPPQRRLLRPCRQHF